MPVQILYDGACPLCRQTLCLLDRTDQPFATVDARTDSTLRDAATAAGIDLDQGFVVAKDGQLYAGTAAARQLSALVAPTGWRNRAVQGLFGSATRARLFYPLCRAARRVVLLLIGQPLIRNLRKTAPQKTAGQG